MRIGGGIEQGLTRQWPWSLFSLSLSPLEGKEEEEKAQPKNSASSLLLLLLLQLFFFFLLSLPPPPLSLHRLVHSPPTWPPQVKIVLWQLKGNPKPGLFFFSCLYTKTTNPPPKANRKKKRETKKRTQLCSHHWRVVVAVVVCLSSISWAIDNRLTLNKE